MSGRVLTLRPGETLMVAGEQSDDVYRLQSGELDVLITVGDQTPIRAARLHAGDLVGELALSLIHI